MRTGISIDVSPASRARLDAIVADRNSPQKHVWRARIVLLSADGAGTVEIMRTAGVSKTAVWRWQERFMQEGAVSVGNGSILRVGPPIQDPSPGPLIPTKSSPPSGVGTTPWTPFVDPGVAPDPPEGRVSGVSG
jgi:hypothetical protein